MHPRNRIRTSDTEPGVDPGLNQALLAGAYGLKWSLPRGAHCPSVPSRTDYIHHLADLLSGGDDAAIPRGRAVRMIDIGAGSGCVSPLIGACEYGWSFVATDTDKAAMHWARQIVRVNTSIRSLIEHRFQPHASACFEGVAKQGERFDASLCVSGGDAEFIATMIDESAARPRLCRWFTTLVPKSGDLPRLRQALSRAHATDTRVIPLVHDQKKSCILAWTFQGP
ncbi:MAG TPA: RlmF-related methyltransferase [Vicinamibacterales bacterium]|nr:RlmF-related methyltransferase [Vicinamibacterales bacterium]